MTALKGKSPATGGAASARPAGFGIADKIGKIKLKKAGGSLTTTIPAPARNLLNLSEGQEMAVSVEGNRLVFEAEKRPSYTLDELIAQCDFDAPYSEEERVWLDEAPVGRELL